MLLRRSRRPRRKLALARVPPWRRARHRSTRAAAPSAKPPRARRAPSLSGWPSRRAHLRTSSSTPRRWAMAASMFPPFGPLAYRRSGPPLLPRPRAHPTRRPDASAESRGRRPPVPPCCSSARSSSSRPCPLKRCNCPPSQTRGRADRTGCASAGSRHRGGDDPLRPRRDRRQRPPRSGADVARGTSRSPGGRGQGARGTYYGGSPAFPNAWSMLETDYVQTPFPQISQLPISSGFGYRPGGMHGGTDIPLPPGQEIRPIANGVVSAVWQGNNPGGGGYAVFVDHNINGQFVQSWYPHMQAGSIRVEVGQVVDVSTVVGQVGSTGRSTGPHLHLEFEEQRLCVLRPPALVADPRNAARDPLARVGSAGLGARAALDREDDPRGQDDGRDPSGDQQRQVASLCRLVLSTRIRRRDSLRRAR
ncbi:Peptidase family M23 [Agrococcus carbonis]|uniref:Peptidase family M23 n=1 Tax=Agrococcus carbonis TaxID=684552 RepID=A0A1H1KRT0_9MICO|nr:Peptidase family M23 [Agrococcus carbonis]